MKEHVRLILLATGWIFLAAGCGGGGGDDDDGGASGTAVGLAPQSISGRAIRLFENNGMESRVELAGNQFVQPSVSPEQTPRNGTYTYTASMSAATLTLIDASSDEIRVFNLTFASADSGSFQASSNRGTTSAGSFTLASGAVPPNDGPGPSPDPGTDSGSGTGGAEAPPIGEGGLDGRVIRVTRSTGQTHTYSFTGNQFLDSDPPEQGIGTYSFTRNGPQAMLVLNYTSSTGPVSLAGDQHEMQLTFATEAKGTYTSTYRVSDGTVIPQDGAFEVTQ